MHTYQGVRNILGCLDLQRSRFRSAVSSLHERQRYSHAVEGRYGLTHSSEQLLVWLWGY